MKSYRALDRLSISVLSLAMILVFFAFVPGSFLPSPVLKGYIFVVGVLVSFALWLFGRLVEGKFTFPRSGFFLSLLAVVLIVFVSALFSHTPTASFLGEGFEQNTFIIIALCALFCYLASFLFRSQGRATLFLSIFFVGYVVLALFQLVHIFFPSITAFGVFTNKLAGPVGTWNDFIVLSGGMLVGFTLMLEFLNPSRFMRLIAWLGGILALGFVVIANIFSVWILVGVFSLFVLVYKIISSRTLEKRPFPRIAFTLGVIALFFIPANSLIGNIFTTKLGTSYVNVTPSILGTGTVALHSLKAHPVVGIGPNQFFHEWLQYRPVSVNTSVFWDIPFPSGHNYFITIAFLSGILGVLAFIALIFFYFRDGIKNVFTSSSDAGKSRFVFSLFILSTYFFVSLLIGSPSFVIVATTFLFVGIFFASIIASGQIKEGTLNFLSDQRTSFFTILTAVVFLLASASTLYASTGRFISIVYFNKSIRDAASGDFAKADRRISQAIALSNLPSYHRARITLSENALQKLVETTNDKTSTDAVKNSLQQIISIGDSSAREAIALNPKDIQNYLVLGDFMRILVPLKVEGALDASKSAYTQASLQAPSYPKPYLALARLYFDAKDNATARTYIDTALEKKPNYTDAYFLLAQIEVADGNIAGAAKKLESAASVDPNNPDIYFELGLLRYQAGSYADAEFSFNRAVYLDNNYLNAWFFLALTEDKLGKHADGIAILEKLHEGLPDNAEVTQALNTMRAGGTQTADKPASSKIEKAKKLPVDTSKTPQQ